MIVRGYTNPSLSVNLLLTPLLLASLFSKSYFYILKLIKNINFEQSKHIHGNETFGIVQNLYFLSTLIYKNKTWKIEKLEVEELEVNSRSKKDWYSLLLSTVSLSLLIRL